MGVDTKALFVAGPNHIEIAEALAAAYGCTPSVEPGISGDGTYFRIYFNVPADKQDRMMHVHLGHVDERDPDENGDRMFPFIEPATLVSLGCWGASVAIMETLCRRFGGFVLDEDTGTALPRFIDVDAGEEQVPVVLSPEAEAAVAISKVVPGDQAAVLRDIVRSPEKTEAVLEILQALVKARAAGG